MAPLAKITKVAVLRPRLHLREDHTQAELRTRTRTLRLQDLRQANLDPLGLLAQPVLGNTQRIAITVFRIPYNSTLTSTAEGVRFVDRKRQSCGGVIQLGRHVNISLQRVRFELELAVEKMPDWFNAFPAAFIQRWMLHWQREAYEKNRVIRFRYWPMRNTTPLSENKTDPLGKT